jgi:hypothetical protein
LVHSAHRLPSLSLLLADTEGSFIVERLAEMATALLREVEVFSQSKSNHAQSLSLECLLSGIHCYRVHDHTELIALLNQLEDFLETHPKVSFSSPVASTCKLTSTMLGEVNSFRQYRLSVPARIQRYGPSVSFAEWHSSNFTQTGR